MNCWLLLERKRRRKMLRMLSEQENSREMLEKVFCLCCSCFCSYCSTTTSLGRGRGRTRRRRRNSKRWMKTKVSILFVDPTFTIHECTNIDKKNSIHSSSSSPEKIIEVINKGEEIINYSCLCLGRKEQAPSYSRLPRVPSNSRKFESQKCIFWFCVVFFTKARQNKNEIPGKNNNTEGLCLKGKKTKKTRKNEE
jgi:hypothetical protein